MKINSKITFLLFLTLLSCQICFAQYSVETKKPYVTKVSNKLITVHYFKKGKEFRINLIIYDDKLYSQAYKTFLANRNISDAYAIATAAVVQKPDSVLWRKRLIEVARWNNLPRIALQNAVYLVKKGDQEALNTAVTIARQLNDNFTLAELCRIQISLGLVSPKVWKGLIRSEEALGNPEAAVKQLKLAIKKEPKLFNYLQLAKLYQNMGDIQAEKNILDEAQAKFGINPEIALRQTVLLYSQGDINDAYKKLLSAFHMAKPNNYVYWRTLGQLAWSLYDFKRAIIAYNHLEKFNKLNESDLINFIRILEKSNAKKAFALSRKGWREYKSDFFLISLLNLTPQTKEWGVLSRILENLPEQTKQRLATNPYYIATAARMWGELGQFRYAQKLYQRALKQFPDSMNLKYDYLWFLIDYEQKIELAFYLKKWRRPILRTTKLWQPAAAGYILLGRPNAALKFYQHEYASKKNDYVWLVNLADVLNAINEPAFAMQTRQRAWRLLLKRIKTQKQLLTRDELINYGILAMYEAPADLTQSIMAHLANNYDDVLTKKLLMTWALKNDNKNLAEYIWYFYSNDKETPLWIQQTIALHNNDQPHLQKLLYNSAAKLPYNDRTIAARRIGEERMAQDLAYRGLSEHPQDSSMYNLFTETMLASANKVGIKQFYQTSGYVTGPKTYADATWFVTPRTSISPFAYYWNIRSKDKTQFLTPMDHDRSAGMKIKMRHKKGYIEGKIGQRKSLCSFWFGSITGTYDLTSKLNSKFSLEYNEQNSESTALLIAGMADSAKLSFDYKCTPRDSFNVILNQSRYKSQDKVTLGSGQSLEAYYQHKFKLSYPDWNYAIFGTTRRYHHSGRLSAKAQEIIPTNQAANLDFYLSKGFTRYGAVVGVGQAYREEYTHAWRPFAEISIFNNTRFGFGSYMNMGIAGSVFGRDHLVLYYTRSLGLEASGQKDYLIGLAYEHYF